MNSFITKTISSAPQYNCTLLYTQKTLFYPKPQTLNPKPLVLTIQTLVLVLGELCPSGPCFPSSEPEAFAMVALCFLVVSGHHRCYGIRRLACEYSDDIAEILWMRFAMVDACTPALFTLTFSVLGLTAHPAQRRRDSNNHG